MSIWLCQADLEAATSRATVIACFDDANMGEGGIDQNGICNIIDRAEQEVLSWLGEYGPPPFSDAVMAQLKADTFLKACAVEYAAAYMFERHPEYVRSDGRVVNDRLKRAKERMERVLDGRQRPPAVVQRPANVGGVARDGAARIYIDDANGCRNSGDY